MREMAMSKCVMRACLLVFLLVCLGEMCNGVPVFNVNQFGAKADGHSDNTRAFMATWNAACGWSGNIAYFKIPAGVYMIGPISFIGPCKPSKIVFQLTGMIKAWSDLDRFPKDWISFQQIDGLIITGGGVFHGQGELVWPEKEKSGRQLLPVSIMFSYITNSEVRGISSVNSKSFHMHVFKCRNVDFHNLRIVAPAESPNTDGINMRYSSYITVQKSVIGTGDDCVAIGPGSEGIIISNVVCGPGHGFSIGSLGKYQGEEDVSAITVRDSLMSNTDNGVRIKTWPDSKSSISVRNVTFENIQMKNVINPIIIDQDYCGGQSCSAKNPSSVKISDVSFSDIRGTSKFELAVDLACSRSFPCQGIKLHNINLKQQENGAPTTSSCSNARGTSSGIQMPDSCI